MYLFQKSTTDNVFEILKFLDQILQGGTVILTERESVTDVWVIENYHDHEL